MGRLVMACLVAGIAMVGAASPATAEPADLVPYCSGDQTPMDTNCRAPSSQVFTHGESGVSPDLPYGVNPGNEPVI